MTIYAPEKLHVLASGDKWLRHAEAFACHPVTSGRCGRHSLVVKNPAPDTRRAGGKFAAQENKRGHFPVVVEGQFARALRAGGALLQIGGSLSGRAGTLLGNVHERVFECTRGTSTSDFARIEPSMPLHAVSPRFAAAGMSKVATMAAPRRLGFGRAACSAHSQMSYRQIRSRRAQSNACPRGV